MSNGVQVCNGLKVYRGYAESSDSSTMENPLGATLMLDDGRAFRYLRAKEAVAIGQLVKAYVAIKDDDVDAAASDATLTSTSQFTAAEYDDGGCFAVINANTGIGQVRRVISNTASVLYLDRAWSTAVDATSDFVTFSPYWVKVTASACDAVAGVAISAISSGYYGWFQIGGLCPQVRFAGNTDAGAALEGCVASAAAGVAKGFTNGGTTADEAAAAFGYPLVAWAGSDSAGTGVPVMLTRVL